jgi:glycosyltransferase involved in cell wall biosynthesis
MVKFSSMLKDCLNSNMHQVTFTRPTNLLSKRISNQSGKKILIYLEKKIIFPLSVAILAKRVRAKYILVSDHSDSRSTFLTRNLKRIIVCHDLFAIQAMLGDIPNIAQSVREKIDLRLNYASLKMTDFFIAISHSTATSIKHYFPAIPVEVLYLTVSEVSESNANDNLEGNLIFGKFCLLPMNSHWRKNRLEGIKAWTEIRQVTPNNNLDLVIIGNQLDQEELHFLRESDCLTQLHVRSNVSEGFLNSLYSKCEFVIFTSRYEGFGLPIIESNSHARLTLHSDLTVLNEISGPHNVKLMQEFAKNDWVKIWNDLTSQERRIAGLDYFANTYSIKKFEVKLLKILEMVKQSANGQYGIEHK